MNSPKITVLCTVYNGIKYFDRAIPSILSQTYENFEFLIINDGSNDGTLEKLLKIEDPRVKVIDAGRLGRIKAMNFGISLAKTDLIAVQDFDDVSFSDRLQIQSDFMMKNSEVVWCGGAYINKNESRNENYTVNLPLVHNQIVNHMAHSIPFAHTLVMFRKSAVQSVGLYEDISDSLEDFRLALRLAQNGFKLGNVKDVLGVHHAHSESFWNSTIKYKNRQNSIRKLQLEAIKTLDIPKWKVIYPIGRFVYHKFPSKLKKIIRTKVVGVNES